MSLKIGQQFHGYRSGHQLLGSSVRLAPSDQEVVDRLSDMAGPLRPSERFDPYLTAYPLPSGEFYVFARTVQDLTAPRAGCVLTKSLLIPMDFWAEKASPVAFVEILEMDGDIPYSIDEPLARGTALPVVKGGSALVELSEALFLEKRVPIVMFDIPEAPLISMRLLTSLWPAARANFSLCTFALAPRFLAGRPFDLLFAPKTARSRFADWEGRRIEIRIQDRDARHQWSRLINHRIFESPVPHLIDRMALRQLGAEQDSSENVLRLSLLWDDLREKGTSSPAAVLGLLDIANSRNSTVASWPILQPAITRALNLAASQTPPAEAWAFIRVLLGKTSSIETKEIVQDNVARAVSSLAKRDFDATFSALASLELDEQVEVAIIKAIAASLTQADANSIANGLVRLAGHQIAEFCLRSAACRKVVMLPDLEIDALSAFDKLLEALEIDEELVERLRPVMLPFVERQEHAPLLALLLKGAPTHEVLDAVSTVWKKTSTHKPAIARTFVDLSTERNLRLEVRDEFAAVGVDAVTDAALLDLSGDKKADLDWLLNSAFIGKRRPSLLRQWLSQRSDQSLEGFVGEEGTADHILSVLLSGKDPAFDLAVRVLLRNHIPSRTLMSVGLGIYEKTSGNDRKRLAGKLVYRVVTDPTIEPPTLLEEVLARAFGSYDFSVVINDGLAGARDGGFASRLIEALGESGANVRREAIVRIEAIAATISRRRKFDLDFHGVAALCKLLNDRQVPGSARLHASSLLLPAAMAAPGNKAASNIILATFPSVYEELRRDDDHFDIWRMFTITDWDKCKTARKDLVKAYLRSDWPPVDLARIAGATRDPERIFKRLLKEPRGASYLQSIVEDGGNLPPSLKSLLANLLKSSGKRGTAIGDWET